MHSLDSDGLTPLMVVVSSSLINTDDSKVIEMSEFLLSKGADKNVTSNTGLSAYGMLCKKRRSTQDFLQSIVGLRDVASHAEAIDQLAKKLEPLLKPSIYIPGDEAFDEEDREDSEDESN